MNLKINNNIHSDVLNFGCRLNSYESSVIKKYLHELRIKNCLVINTCAVTSEAERQLKQKIRQIVVHNPCISIVLTGCAVEKKQAEYMRLANVVAIIQQDEKLQKNTYANLLNQNILTQVDNYNNCDTIINSSCNDFNIEHSHQMVANQIVHSSLIMPQLPKEVIMPQLPSDEMTPLFLKNSCNTNKISNESIHTHKDMYKNASQSTYKNITQDITQNINQECAIDEFDSVVKNYKIRLFIGIQTGCEHDCTYCYTRIARGTNKSTSVDQVVEIINNTLRENAHLANKEIVLTGVNITSYSDNGKNLYDLIKIILANCKDLKRLRLSSLDPNDINDELIELILNEEKILKHIHLSIQSGDDLILARMKRRHRTQHVLEVCKKLLSHKDMIIGSDFIIGFPTEEQENFENTIQFIKKSGITLFHLFQYSIRPETKAALMPQVSKNIKKERFDLMNKICNEITNSKLKTFIGCDINGIIENQKYAKTDNFLDIEIIKNGENIINEHSQCDHKNWLVNTDELKIQNENINKLSDLNPSKLIIGEIVSFKCVEVKNNKLLCVLNDI